MSAENAVVTTTREGRVLVVTINNPPVNALSQAVRQGLADAVAQAQGDDDIKAVLLVGSGKAFIAGADIREFGKPAMPPSLPDVLMQLDIATDLPELFTQRTRLLTALSLLFDRACQAVTGQSAGQLKLCAYQNEQELYLEVHDSGQAPAVTATHRLLQPQTDNGGKRNDTIELGFAQNIVNDHRGVIEVETSDLGGSCIRLRLPLCAIIREDKK